ATGSLLLVAVLVSGVSVRADDKGPRDKKAGGDAPNVVIVVEDDGAKDAKADGKKVEKELRLILRGDGAGVIQLDPQALIKLHEGVIHLGDEVKVRNVLDKVELHGSPLHAILLQEAKDDGKARKLKQLEEATKKLQEAAKQAGNELPE